MFKQPFKKIVHCIALALMISVFAHGVLHADDSGSGKSDTCHYCQLAEQSITVDESVVSEKKINFISLSVLFPEGSNRIQNILNPLSSPRGPPKKLNFVL